GPEARPIWYLRRGIERKRAMTNLEKYDRLFLTAFRVKPEELPGLKYRGIPLWDSLGHMDLMGDMEETFKISIGTADVLDFSSYEKGKEILAKYGVEL
ncbi:acyl carrier protein, partial [Flavonifractor plautii]